MQRLVLTGAKGFVGHHILKALSEVDCNIRLIVRTLPSTQQNIFIDKFEVIKTVDLFSEGSDALALMLQDADTVIHAAWYAEPGKYLQSPKNIDCLSGTLALAKACVQTGVRRFVGVGTCFEYDLSSGYLSIDTPLRPTTPYATAKAAAFLSLSQYFAAAGIEFAWCRLFYLYGEGEDERRLGPYLRAKLAAGESADLTSGEQIRDFMDVKDAGRMIAEVAKGRRQGPVNVCSATPVTVRKLAEQIADEYGRRDLLHFNARPDNLVDPPCVVGVKTGVAS